VNTGTWQAETQNFSGVTWNVYRTGGAPVSIKLQKNVNYTGSDTGRPLWIAPPTFKAFEWTPGSVGNYTAKVYVAFKNFTTPEDFKDKFVVILEIPRAQGRDVLYSSIQGTWSDDSVSTWNNDSGLTQKVLELPFTATLTEAVSVRMHFKWHDAVGYMYLDPNVVFE